MNSDSISKPIPVGISDAEEKQLRAAADVVGLTLSEYVRRKLKLAKRTRGRPRKAK